MRNSKFHLPSTVYRLDTAVSILPSARLRRAYTLLELLAALTLTVLLASATLAITRNLMHQAKAPSKTAPAWQRRLQLTLTQELTEAEQVQRVPGGMEIQGPLQPKPSITDGGHRPLKIIWRTDKGQLLREELDLLTGTYRRQIVLLGVDRLQITQPTSSSGGTYQLTLSGPALSQGMTISVPRGGGTP